MCRWVQGVASVYLQYMNSDLNTCLYGSLLICRFSCVCWVHRSTDVLSPYGGQVGLSQNSPLCGDLAATLFFPSHSCMNDVAPHMWCCLSFCLWVFDCTLLLCVCGCVWGNGASSMWEYPLPGECVCVCVLGAGIWTWRLSSASMAQVAAASPSPPGLQQMPHRHSRLEDERQKKWPYSSTGYWSSTEVLII